jgi:hypothetical protein
LTSAAVINRKIKGLMDDAPGKMHWAVSVLHRFGQVSAQAQGLGWLTASALDAANADDFLSASLKSGWCELIANRTRNSLRSFCKNDVKAISK